MYLHFNVLFLFFIVLAVWALEQLLASDSDLDLQKVSYALPIPKKIIQKLQHTHRKYMNVFAFQCVVLVFYSTCGLGA